MKIHEYQGKEIFRKYGVPTPRGVAAFSVEEAVRAAGELGGKVWVVKAQIHAGGRGKGGGVKVAKSSTDVGKLAKQILGMQLVTHQTGPQGQKVRRLLIEEGADIAKELYVGMVADRGTQRVVLMASSDTSSGPGSGRVNSRSSTLCGSRAKLTTAGLFIGKFSASPRHRRTRVRVRR
jgi:succinyl-CoA synthetase beta subunit